MQASKIVFRIAKFLGKVMLGLLVILLTTVALIHLPVVQEQLTRKLSSYLSSKIKARVDIQRIRFSILGKVAIDDLAVWDPDNNKILSVHKIEAASSIYNLVTGDFIFDEVSLTGVDGKLIQSQEGLNIQFIVDAFKSAEKPVTAKSSTINLQFKTIYLENILFEFTSTTSGTSVDVNLGTLISQEAEFSTNPTKIKANQIILEHTVVNTLSTAHIAMQDTSVAPENKKLLSPDFGTGILFEIRNIALKDNDVSFHRDQVMDTQKFDPDHITLKNIQINLSDILIREDTLTAGLQSLAVQLPGFTLANAKADIQLNRKQLFLSGLHLESGTNELHAELTAPYNLTSAEDTAHARVEIALQGQINPKDLTYFFSDSVMNQFNPLGLTELVLKGNYALGEGRIEALNLKTGNSRFHADGVVNDVLDLNEISWKDLTIDAAIGSDFKRILTPFLRNINVPPAITLQLKSSGNLKKIYTDAKVFTSWGNAKANGLVTQQLNNTGIDINLTGEKVDLGEWLNLSWIGPMDLSAGAKGIIGEDQQIEINGLINNIEMLDQPIHHIAFQGSTRKDTASVSISIEDPNYRSETSAEISFAGPLMFINDIQFNDFKLGALLHTDSTLSISGDTKSKITIDQSFMEGFVWGDSILLKNQSMEYLMDTLAVHAMIFQTKTDFEYYTDYAKANLVSNFDIRDASEVIRTWTSDIVKTPDTGIHRGNRTAHLNIALENANFIKLLGVDVDDFASLRVTGEFNEQEKAAWLHTSSGKFKGYGISLDTLNMNLTVLQDSLGASMNATNLYYDSIQLGKLNFDVVTKGDTARSKLLLATDSITLMDLRARILPTDSGAFVYPDKLLTFDNAYSIDPKNPVHVGKNNLVFNHFHVGRDDMQVNLNGDLNYFDVSLRNVDLIPLNFLLSADTTVINKGHLSGELSYSRDQQLKLNAAIDSLILYDSNPLTIAATAVSDGNLVPFEFRLTNASNRIDLKGQYFSDNAEVDAYLQLEVDDPKLFEFLVSGVIEEMKGTIKGKAAISGPLQMPAFKGSLRFIDASVTTVNPRLTFNVENDSIVLDNSSLLFDHFTLYDQERHPLTIDGNITSKDYQSFAYELQINSDQYTLFNNPDSIEGKLRGQLVIDSDVRLKGNEKDRNVDANITIKDVTDLTFVTSSDDIELLKAEGIVDFIDPATLLDSAALEPSSNYYDSLIASLPDINLNSKIAIEDNAAFRVIIDEQSGDYIEASGRADLELGYDRSGNLRLAGNYTIKNGVYRLSFYDLVKKNFTLTQGSSINWSGSPENGDLNIKAVYTVESNSIGLIGHEIGENEKSIYKRSLDYQVGININGTIERPIISFSLDLPQNDKASYPVLANKLDRLRQPEYESELNKQVFGLLVLGGFLPESTGADINSNLIATTALANSVNSLLASQLNRFANQYIKGVNIDVGIQSYSDYSSPGGKTQTAMDFRVSKSLMNERLSLEIGGDFDISQDQSGANTGTKNYRGDIAIIYDLTGNGDKQLKLFNNETYDIVYQEIRNTGISLIFIREFTRKGKKKNSIDTVGKDK